MIETLYQAATLIIPLMLAIVFHEIAHGWTARALGDPTADEQKRLSLNPLRHVDPIGTFVVPGLLKLVGAPVFGWAKPVPVDKWRLRNPRFGMMAVAAAGPGMNLALGLLAAIAIGLLARPFVDGGEPSATWIFVALNLQNFLLINIFLALFNLLPIPPFDGSHIVEGLLPERAAATYDRLRVFGFPLIFILLIGLPMLVPGLSIVEKVVLPPVEWLHGLYFSVVRIVAGG